MERWGGKIFAFFLGVWSFLGPVRAQGRVVTLERALDEGTVKLGAQGLGQDKVRLHLQSLVRKKLLVFLPRGSLFGPTLVINAGRPVNRVQEMVTLKEARIPLGPKDLVSRDLPAACLNLWARIPLPRDVLVYRPRKRVPGGEGLFRVLESMKLPWEGWQAALWILTDDARFKEMNRSRAKRPGDPRPKPIRPHLFAAGMMAVERSGRSLVGKRCSRDRWVLVAAARPCLYPQWARDLSMWALGKLHARGHPGEFPQVILSILEKEGDAGLCLEAFKAAAAAPGPGVLAAMKKCLARFPKFPSEPGFSPRRVFEALSFSAGKAWAAPVQGGCPPSSSKAGLDRLLAEIQGGGPETERAFRALVKMGKKVMDPGTRARVGRILASYLQGEFPFAETAFPGAVAAFRDTWDLGALLRTLDRREKARPTTRCVWVRLVSLYPDWGATRWLLGRLSDPDRRVRYETVRVLRKRPDAVGSILTLARRGRTQAVRLAALDALAVPSERRNPPLERAVFQLLADPSYKVREKALGLLVLWKCRDYLPQMLTLCAEDPSQRVRWTAAKGLQALGDAGTGEKIRSLLSMPGNHARELRWALAGLKARR